MMRIRPMLAADALAVAWIDRLSNPLPWSLNAYQREPERPHSRAWVLEAPLPTDLTCGAAEAVNGLPPLTCAAGSQVPVAFLLAWRVVDEFHIANLAVHPAFRRRGMARALLAHALQAAEQEELVSALLEVRASNAPALALYRAFGFAIVGRRKGYYHDNGEDALLMTLSPLERWRK